MSTTVIDPTSAAAVVAENLAAYNARDIEGFMASFADNVEIWDQQSGALVMQGRAQVRRAYADVFANSPLLHSRVVHRSVVGAVVVDHEIVTGRHGGDAEVLISYLVLAGRIVRVWWSRAPLTPAPKIRQAGPVDVEVVASIGRATYVEHFAHIWSAGGLQAHLQREFDTATMATEMTSGGASYFLAESGGSVIGFAKLRHPRPVPLDPSLNGAELQKIYLLGTLVRRGTGILLLDACVQHVMSLGLERLWLDVLERNTLAICFYLRHGFKFFGQESFQTDRSQEVMLVMMRSLPK